MNTEALDRLRTHFPVTENWIYMNHASISPLSRDMAAVMTLRINEITDNGAVHSGGWWEDVNHCRGMYAELLAARPEEISFLDNTTQGVNLVANGLRWKTGDNVVCVDIEYPANVYAWMNLKELGVETRMVANREGRVEVKDVVAAIDSRTRVVALSFVEFHNGFRNDLAAIGSECRRRGVLFFVDAVQGLGALCMDVGTMNIDILAAHSRKWLLCPGGKGVFYVRIDVLDQLRVTSVGAGSVVNAGDYLNYDLTYLPGARRFEGGGDSPIAFAATRAMLSMFVGVGIGRVEQQVLSITDRLAQGLLAAGYVLDSHREKECKSGILTFHHPSRSSEELSKRLMEAHVVHTHRVGKNAEETLRLSPHFYNSEDEVDAVLGVLA